MKMDLENLDRHVFGNSSKAEEFDWEKNPLDGEESPADELFEKKDKISVNKIKTLCSEAEKKLRNTSLLERRKVTLRELPTFNGNLSSRFDLKTPLIVKPGELPSPKEFGGGNPFLMFLCITLLCQH